MSKLFSKQADYYAQYRPVYPKDLYDFIFRHLVQKSFAWDCGTGSGQVAAILAEHFQKVYASDISTEQMVHAPEKENIEYHNVPAENTGYPDNTFDLITVGQAIHWFDFDKFYEEVNRTAKPGALLSAFGYGKLKINRELDPIIHGFYKDMFEEYFSEVRRHINNEYQTIPFPFEEIPTPTFKIRLQWTIDDLAGFFNSWSTVQKTKTEKGYNPADTILEKIKSKLPSDQPFEVEFPVFMRLGRVN